MPNALIDETSPYLLQHAHNPVDWLPWNESAFARAREENRLVFLSVGYSTCHWCHVMERESFENPAVAEVMNRLLVNVKVDREERPDIDSVYMAYVQATTGQGGWPMSVWLTPDGKPVFGGTYFPPEDRHGRPGFVRVCHELARLWRDDRERMEESAARVIGHLRAESAAATVRGLPSSKVFGDYLDRCESMFDTKLGGFGGAPKFPRPVVLRALMRMSERFGAEGDEGAAAWRMAERTLRAMAAGGMHDHLGGGFHRYSVDRYWHVPHYEKMLYDQAQLAMAYMDAWQISGDDHFREVTSGIFGYLLETTRDGGGAFHAAEDADSLANPDSDHKAEGAFWVWEADEIHGLLDPRAAMVFSKAYGVEAGGNARPESDPHGELEGKNTLFRATSDADLAMMFDCSVDEIRDSLTASRAILARFRESRPHPHRDDKIVTAWNGLAIGALARGARLFGRTDLAHAAVRAAEFIRRELWDGASLFRSFRAKRGEARGFPADYAFLISGLLELHATSPADGWLDWALELQRAFDEQCWDAALSGYVMRPSLGGETLLVIREDYDGAEPSPNHVAADNLLRMAALTGHEPYAKRAEALLRAGSSGLEAQPFAAPELLAAFDLMERGVMKYQVPDETDARTLRKLHSIYQPRAVFAPGQGTSIIVCEGMTCRVADLG
jgi:uncharacterized protein YyaL (SSP411 family)